MKFWKYAAIAALWSIAAFAAEPRLVHLATMPLAKIVSHPQPEYPQDALAMKLQGAVRVSVVIGEDGHVVSAKSISGPKIFGPAAAQAVRQWVFEPTTVDEHPVRVVSTVTVSFALDREGRPMSFPERAPLR